MTGCSPPLTLAVILVLVLPGSMLRATMLFPEAKRALLRDYLLIFSAYSIFLLNQTASYT
jgi:hypothetical protein